MNGRTKNIKLKRELGLWSTTLCGVGIILGAGIYALIGKAAGMAGPSVWLSFLIASIVAGLTGLSYAELSSRFPRAGAEYDYTKKAFGRSISFIVGWLLFIGGSIAAAAVALGFAGYFAALFNTPIILVAILLIIVTSYIVYYGIKESAWIAILFTLIEAGGLILIILLGLAYINPAEINYLAMPNGFSGILGAAALIFFAYIGFEEIARLSEETKNPTRNIPRALILSIIITTIIYILVGISVVSIMGWEALGASNAPLADVAMMVIGPIGAILLSIIALFSTTNTVMLEILASARLVFGMGRDKALPKKFGHIHPEKRTPWVATMFIMILAIAFAALGDIATVAGITDFTIFLAFMAINLTVIVLRFSLPSRAGFKVPISIGRFPLLPLAGFVTSLLLLISLELSVIYYGIAILLFGVIVNEGLRMRR